MEVSLDLAVSAGADVPADVTVVGGFAESDEQVDERLGVDRWQLDLNGFTGKVRTRLLVNSMDGVVRVAIGSEGVRPLVVISGR